MKKHASLSALLLVLAAAPAAADLRADALHEARARRTAGSERRVLDAGGLTGTLVLPAGGEQGAAVGLLLDESGASRWKLRLVAERRRPQGNESARFEHGTLVGDVTAIDEGASVRRALVRGSWSRFGSASGAGELAAVMIDPESARVLGTLRAPIGFEDEPLLLAAQAGDFAPVRVRRERPRPPLAQLGIDPGPCLHSPIVAQHVAGFADASAKAEPKAGEPIVDPAGEEPRLVPGGSREVPTRAHGSFRGRWTLLGLP